MDYVITYIGIRQGLIEEANPLMIWLLSLPFIWGVCVRTAMICVLFLPLHILKERTLSKIGIKVGLIANICVMFLHFYWISKI